MKEEVQFVVFGDNLVIGMDLIKIRILYFVWLILWQWYLELFA